MTTTAPDVESATVVSVALRLADLLGLGLPEPGYVSFFAGSFSPCIALQFDGPELPPALPAWAARFGVPVEMPEPGERFARVHFTYSGVRCECYAKLGADE